MFSLFLTSLLTYLQKIGKNSDKKSGFLKNEAIQDIVNTVWFKSLKADGLTFKPLFNPFPDVAMSLIFTTVSSIIVLYSCFDPLLD